MSNQQQEEDDIVIISKNTKILYKIHNKINIFVKSAYHSIIDETNISMLCTKIMRELNKENLYGFEKRRLCVELLTLLLEEFGVPHVIGKFCVEEIINLIEVIYAHNMHRYKTDKKCDIL